MPSTMHSATQTALAPCSAPGKGNAAALEEIKARADHHAQDVLPIIDDIRSTGSAGLRKIAEELNARGILTARQRQWYPTTVRNLLTRSGRLV